MRRSGLLFVVVLLGAACSGPPVPTPISDEPVCPDFEVGGTIKTRMRGGLKHPVAVTILDDDDVVMRATVIGKRTPDDPPTRILLRDANAEYEVQWAQCENERAPRPAADAPARAKGAPAREASTEYECGNAKVYKTDKLITKKGDLSTHALTFPAPPSTDCWTGVESTAQATASATPDAGAPPEPNERADDAGADIDAGASAQAADAGADASSEAPADAAAPSVEADAGKKEPNKKPAPAEKKRQSP